MKLICTLFLYTLIFSLSAQVTYKVKVPSGTKACFIAGEMNGWSQQEMIKLNNTTFSISIQNANKNQQYKYCSGPTWAFVEKDASGADVPNRSYRQKDTVAKWAAIWDPNNIKGPVVPNGTVKRFYFRSKYVDNRVVDVWLPEAYTTGLKYSVLYMHDGQNLFDSATNTFNGVEWEADEKAHKLIKKGLIRNTIIVGAWNNGAKRYAEYFPQKVIDSVPEPSRTLILNDMPGGPKGDDYLKFLVYELKPFIDSTFSTHKNQQNTFIGGSSMGGLISMYAMCEYPKVFSGAACMSTHWPGTLAPGVQVSDAFNRYMLANLPSPSNHRWYFDHGTVGLDASYAAPQKLVDTIMRYKGYDSSQNGNWMTRIYPGHDHTEGDWAKRLDTPFYFLLKKPFKITSFKVIWINNNTDVSLTWTTGIEVNTKRIEVQRSHNSSNYSSIASLPAAGNSNTSRNYQHIDVDVNSDYSTPPAYLYYRLKVVYTDGSFTYSGVKKIDNPAYRNVNGPYNFRIYPNPASDIIYVKGLETLKHPDVSIYDIMGNRLKVPIRAGSNYINIGGLAHGIFYIKINGEIMRFSKQ